MKLHRKIKHNEDVCRQHDLGSYAQDQGRNQVKAKSCLSNNSKTTEANLTKLHRKKEHNEKVCCAQELGSYAQGQGHNQVQGQIVPKFSTEANFMTLHRKIKHNEKVCAYMI